MTDEDEALTAEQHMQVRNTSRLLVGIGIAALGPIAYLEHDATIGRLRGTLSMRNDAIDLAASQMEKARAALTKMQADRIVLLQVVHMLIRSCDVPPRVLQVVHDAVASVGEGGEPQGSASPE